MANEHDSVEVRLLRDIARWTRWAALPNARERVTTLLDTDTKKRAYDAMDGASSITAIEAVSGSNHADIRAWVTGWEAEGVVDIGVTPLKATFTLRELGIEPPPPKATRSRKR